MANLVQLSPPLPMGEASVSGTVVAGDRSVSGVDRSSVVPVTAGAGGCLSSPSLRPPAVAEPSADGDLGSLLPATPGPASPSLASLASGERGGQRRDEVRVRSPALTTGGSGAGCLTEQQPAGGGAVGGAGRPGDSDSGNGGVAGTVVVRGGGTRVSRGE